MTVRRWNTGIAVLLLIAALLKLAAVTAPGPRPHGLWRAHLMHDLDLGLDTIPATTEHGGYLELWLFQGNDETTLLHLPGLPQQGWSICTAQASRQRTWWQAPHCR